MLITIYLPDGQKIEKKVGPGPVTIGRSNKSDIIVQDEGLSRSHCIVEYDQKGVFITDLNSSNGVYINGIRIKPNTKTLFDTFLQLSLGPLECTIELESAQKEDSSPLSWAETSKVATRTISKVKTKPSPAFPKSSQKTSGPNFKIMPFVFVMALIIIYFMNRSEVEQTDALPQVSKSQPMDQVKIPAAASPVIEVKDDFAAPASYLEKKGRKNLIDAPEIVQIFGLKDQEGVILESGEVFIFLNPERFLQKPNLAAVSQIPEAKDIIALYEIVKSKLSDDLHSGKYGQIHLLIQSDSGAVSKIYRLHAKHFKAAGQTKILILKEIGNFLEHKNPEQFWAKVSPLAPSIQPIDL